MADPERPTRQGAGRARSAAERVIPPAAPSVTGAPAQLQRLLYILPRASREGGASVAQLAAELRVDEATVRRDVLQVQERDLYLPPAAATAVQIELGADRITVWTSGEFRRPTRLHFREALALDVGLRMAGLASRIDGAPSAPSSGHDDVRARLRDRLQALLASASEAAVEESFQTPELDADPSAIREILNHAAREYVPCRIRYVKPRGNEPDERVIHPYVLALAEGCWYAVGHCERNGEVRVFRLDRVVEARLVDGTFEVAPGFDPDDYLDGHRVLRASEPTREAVVRYSPRVARRVAEAEQGKEQPDGSFLVRHAVADPDWLVRHVLAWGGEAVVLEPAALRERVRECAVRLAEG